MTKINEKISQRLTGINVIMTLLIVWLHISANYGVPVWVSNIAIIAVPCFFAMSSFWYFYSFDFVNPWSSYKTKVQGRFKSVLIPFLIFNILGLLFSIICYEFHPTEYNPLADLKRQGVLYYLYFSHGNGPLWYLRSLFMFILFAPVLGWIIRWSKWSFLLLIPAFIFGQKASYFFFPYWSVNILFGAYVAIYYNEICKWLNSINLFVKLGGVVVLISFAFIFMNEAYIIRCIIPPIMMTIICFMPVFPSTLQKIIAPYTMLIYCLHLPVSRFTSKIPIILHISSPLYSLILATILTVAVIIGIGIILKKFTPVLKVLTGGR